MNHLTVLPDEVITPRGPVSETFLSIGIQGFAAACRYVHQLPYGYNTNRDDVLILFKEKMGSCATKHAVVATLAEESGLAVSKSIGIYPMTEALVTGTQKILAKYDLPYLPMLHCFLGYRDYRVDLTEGNRNGKNGPVEEFLFTARVTPNISEKEEYRLYRQALKDTILAREGMQDIEVKRILHAREEGIQLLKSNI